MLYDGGIAFGRNLVVSFHDRRHSTPQYQLHASTSCIGYSGVHQSDIWRLGQSDGELRLGRGTEESSQALIGQEVSLSGH